MNFRAAVLLSLLLAVPLRARSQTFDLFLASITAPTGSVSACGGVMPAVSILNLGPATSPSAMVTLTIFQGTSAVYGPDTQTVGEIAANSTGSVQFSQAWWPKQAGPYSVTASILAAGDANPSNNTNVTSGSASVQFISKAAALHIVDSALVQTLPPGSSYTEYLFGNANASSVLPPGTVISAWDSSFDQTLAAPSYFAWLDDDPTGFWMHPTTYAIVNACNGSISIDTALSWPVVDGVEDLPNDTGSDYAGGLVLPDGVVYDAVDTSAGGCDPNAWALIIMGPPLDSKIGPELENDLNTARKILTSSGRKPCVPPDHIIVVGDSAKPGKILPGSTKSQIQNAIASLKGKTNKIDFIYLGHGEIGGGSMTAQDGGVPYHTVAEWLLAAGIDEADIIIQACFSGSAISEFSSAHIGNGGKARYLKGTIITSCDKDQITQGDWKTYTTPFLDKILQYLNDPKANLDGDKTTTYIEAVEYGKSRDTILQRGPIVLSKNNITYHTNTAQAGILDSTSHPVQLPNPNASDASHNIIFNDKNGIPKYIWYYQTIDNPSSKNSTIKLFVKNVSKEDAPYPYYITIYCGTGFGAHEFRNIKIAPKAGDTQYVCDIPAGCSPVKIENGPHLDPLPPTPVSTPSDLCVAYPRGELIYEPVIPPWSAGDSMIATIDEVNGWGMTFLPSHSHIPVLTGSEQLVVRGVIPDTAYDGALFHARVLDETTGDTLDNAITILLADSLTQFSGHDTSLTYRWIDYYGISHSFGKSFSAESSVISMNGNQRILMDSGTSIVLSNTALLPDSGASYSLNIQGNLSWDNGELYAPDSGLVLDRAHTKVFSGAVIASKMDGLTLRGDQSNTEVKALSIDSSARYAVNFDGATNCTVSEIQVTNSGIADIRAQNGSNVTLLDGIFDTAKVSVDNTSNFTRAWTIGFMVFRDTITPDSGAILIIRDGSGAMLFRDTTDGQGTAGIHTLVEWTMNGSARTTMAPYAIEVQHDGMDTSFAYSATVGDVVVVDLNEAPSSVNEQTIPKQNLVYFEANTPNPFRDATILRFVLSSEMHATLGVFDLLGREVSLIADENMDGGQHSFEFDSGNYSDGVYFAELSTPSGIFRQPIVLDK